MRSILLPRRVDPDSLVRTTIIEDAGPVVKATIDEAVDKTVNEAMETVAEEDEAVDVDVVVHKRERDMVEEIVALMVEVVERPALRSLVGGSEVGQCESLF